MNYDTQLKQAKHVNFLPYIGEKYAQTSQKILVLGHSHYAVDADSPEEMEKWDIDTERTRTVITEEYREGIADNGTHPYSYVRCFRYMAAALTGKDYHNSDDKWDELAFYEFYQKHAGTTHNSRQNITPELTEISKKALFEVIGILKPSVVIAWGSELAGDYCLPTDGYTKISDDPLGGVYDVFPDTYFWFMKHPSMGFSYEAGREDWIKVQQTIQNRK